MSIWVIVLMTLVFIAFMVLIAILPAIEDDSPGGFNNPDGKWIDHFKNPKPYQVVLWFIGVLILGVIIAAFLHKIGFI